jgi:integrase
MKRFKTDYPGVFYRVADRVGAKGQEKVYYVVYKNNGKVIEAKAGRQYKDDMTPARASQYRAMLIEGKALTPKEKRAKLKAAEKAKSNCWTINRLWDLYCKNNAGNKSLTNEKYKYERYIRSGIGKEEPVELVALDVDRLRLKIQKAGKHTMAARVLELLRRSINYGVKKGLIQPLKFKIEIPKLNNQTTEDLDSEQLFKLIKTLDEDPDQTAANVMRLALFTGMRRGEIFKLKWENIDFRRGFITLQDPKSGSNQTIPLNSQVRLIFESIKKTAESEYIFPGRFPEQHLSDCRKSFTRIAKSAGLPKGFRPLHGLRHVYASMLASSGQVDLYTLQKLLTHKSPLMTQRYAHLRDEALKKASNVAVDIIEKATTKKIEKTMWLT